MDQVKAIARVLGKHIFWIGCGIILLVSTGTWFVARSTLRDEFNDNESKINSKFQTVSTLKSKQHPPTEKSHAEMDKLLARTLDLVERAWQQQYSDQQQILRWDPRLQPDFVSKVRPLKPIELKVDFPTPPEQELDANLLERYANYVDNLLPFLAEVIGTNWRVGQQPSVAPGVAPGAMPGAMPIGEPEKQPLVVWDEQDQARLVGTHFNWTSQPDGAPTTLQMLYAQEDLWVYTALMHIIARTNGDIESRHEGVVKTIETLLIGRAAIGRSGQVDRLMGTGGGYGGDMGGYGEYGSYGEEGYGEGYGEDSEDSMTGLGMGSGMGMGGMGMGSGMGMGGEGDMGSYGEEDGYGGMAQGPIDPGDNRYVDNDYVPLSAQRLREAMRTGGPEDAFLVVAKRMPVRLRLVVDRRKLPRLLAEFGNSALPVEVRQVRVNREGTSAGGYGGYDTGGYGGMMPGMGSMGGGSSMGLGSGYDEEMGSYGSSYGSEYGDSESYEDSYGEEMGSYGYGSTMGGYGSGGYGMGSGDMRSRTSVSSTSRYDVPVEIYGIIYIYNPVDREKLGDERTPAGLTGPTADATGPVS